MVEEDGKYLQKLGLSTAVCQPVPMQLVKQPNRLSFIFRIMIKALVHLPLQFTHEMWDRAYVQDVEKWKEENEPPSPALHHHDPQPRPIK